MSHTDTLCLAQYYIGEGFSMNMVEPVPTPHTFKVMDHTSLILSYTHLFHICGKVLESIYKLIVIKVVTLHCSLDIDPTLYVIRHTQLKDCTRFAFNWLRLVPFLSLFVHVFLNSPAHYFIFSIDYAVFDITETDLFWPCFDFERYEPVFQTGTQGWKTIQFVLEVYDTNSVVVQGHLFWIRVEFGWSFYSVDRQQYVINIPASQLVNIIDSAELVFTDIQFPVLTWDQFVTLELLLCFGCFCLGLPGFIPPKLQIAILINC